MFIRDKPELLSKMKRRMQKRNDSKAKLHAASNLNSHVSLLLVKLFEVLPIYSVVSFVPLKQIICRFVNLGR